MLVSITIIIGLIICLLDVHNTVNYIDQATMDELKIVK